MKKPNSFTLIEILVVVTIISLLTAGGISSYVNFNKQSRDARRKADLEQIRAALEMYKSNSSVSSYPVLRTSLEPTYIKSYPTDPKDSVAYPYIALTSAGATCTVEPCPNYQLSASLEASGSQYQVNPYGGSTITNTPIPAP